MKKTAENTSLVGRRFEMKDLGYLHYFLGVGVQQSPDSGKTWVGQPVYIQNILKKFGFELALHYLLLKQKHVALANTSQKVIWMRQLMEELQSQQVNSIVVYSICSYLLRVSTIIFIDVLKTANIVNKT